MAATLADYEAVALGLGRDPAWLGAMRARVVAERERSALFDTVRFTRQLEAAYGVMWGEYVATGMPAGTTRTPLAVPPINLLQPG